MGTSTISQNHQLSDGNPDGTTMGQSITDKISFFGVTPVVQPAATDSVVTALVNLGLLPAGAETVINLRGAVATPEVVTSTGTTNGSSINMQMTGVTGVLRGLLSVVDYAGTYAGTGTLNVYGVRGYSKLSGTISGGSTVYLAGTQGKVGFTSTGVMSGGRAVDEQGSRADPAHPRFECTCASKRRRH